MCIEKRTSWFSKIHIKENITNGIWKLIFAYNLKRKETHCARYTIVEGNLIFLFCFYCVFCFLIPLTNEVICLYGVCVCVCVNTMHENILYSWYLQSTIACSLISVWRCIDMIDFIVLHIDKTDIKCYCWVGYDLFISLQWIRNWKLCKIAVELCWYALHILWFSTIYQYWYISIS